MIWKLDYLRDDGVLRVVTGGTLTLADYDAMIEDAVAEAERCGGVTAFLLDHRKAMFAMSVMNFYAVPQLNHRLGEKRPERLALLLADYPTLDARLYQARAKNLGLDHKVFTSSDEAIAWLSRRPRRMPAAALRVCAFPRKFA
jgi:hypothetical protein